MCNSRRTTMRCCVFFRLAPLHSRSYHDAAAEDGLFKLHGQDSRQPPFLKSADDAGAAAFRCRHLPPDGTCNEHVQTGQNGRTSDQGFDRRGVFTRHQKAPIGRTACTYLRFDRRIFQGVQEMFFPRIGGHYQADVAAAMPACEELAVGHQGGRIVEKKSYPEFFRNVRIPFDAGRVLPDIGEMKGRYHGTHLAGVPHLWRQSARGNHC